MRPLLLCLLLIPVLASGETAPAPESESPGQVQTAPDPSPQVIQVQLEFIELPHETLTGLLFMRPKGNADAAGLRKEVQELVKTGKAKILDTQIVTGCSGERCSVESVHEYIHPTEFEPAEVPNSVTVPAIPDEKTNPDAAKALTGLITPPNPASFEMRKLGSTLEVQPELGESGKLIKLHLTPDLSWHTGNTVWQERKDLLGNVFKIEEPEFYALHTSSNLVMRDGTYLLAAVLSPKDQGGHADLDRKVMMFVKCDVLDLQ